MPKWKTIKEICMLPEMPKARTLYDWTKVKPRLPFVKKLSGQYYMNIENPDFIARIVRFERLGKNKKKIAAVKPAIPAPTAKPHSKKPPRKSYELGAADSSSWLETLDKAIENETDPMVIASIIDSRMKLEKLYEDTREKRIKNETLNLKYQKESFNIIDWQLAEYLFFGYLNKANAELLKLMPKLEAVILNLVQENDGPGIITRVQRELESIIQEIKKAQAADMSSWKAENGADL